MSRGSLRIFGFAIDTSLVLARTSHNATLGLGLGKLDPGFSVGSGSQAAVGYK